MPTLTQPQALSGLLRTITVSTDGQIPAVGELMRIIEESDGIEAHTYWRVRRIEAAGPGEVAITGEYVGGT